MGCIQIPDCSLAVCPVRCSCYWRTQWRGLCRVAASRRGRRAQCTGIENPPGPISNVLAHRYDFKSYLTKSGSASTSCPEELRGFLFMPLRVERAEGNKGEKRWKGPELLMWPDWALWSQVPWDCAKFVQQAQFPFTLGSCNCRPDTRSLVSQKSVYDFCTSIFRVKITPVTHNSHKMNC